MKVVKAILTPTRNLYDIIGVKNMAPIEPKMPKHGRLLIIQLFPKIV